jgi:hypothetical protein
MCRCRSSWPFWRCSGSAPGTEGKRRPHDVHSTNRSLPPHGPKSSRSLVGSPHSPPAPGASARSPATAPSSPWYSGRFQTKSGCFRGAAKDGRLNASECEGQGDSRAHHAGADHGCRSHHNPSEHERIGNGRPGGRLD